MPKVVIHRTALLLVAILAMLPLQGIQAALGSLDEHAMHAASLQTQAVGHHMAATSDMADCLMHQPGTGENPGGMHCNGNCQLCGACAAGVLPGLPLLGIATADAPFPVSQAHRPAQPSYTLFRPPRT